MHFDSHLYYLFSYLFLLFMHDAGLKLLELLWNYIYCAQAVKQNVLCFLGSKRTLYLWNHKGECGNKAGRSDGSWGGVKNQEVLELLCHREGVIKFSKIHTDSFKVDRFRG